MLGKINSKVVVVLVGLIALILGFFVSKSFHSKNQVDLAQFNGTLLNTPRNISSFDLEGTDGNSFDNSSLSGQWTLVFFGFTHCGFVCPTTMAELGKTYKILEEQNTNPMPKVVMVSIDPDRDDISTIKQYVTSFDPSFYGARGNKEAIAAITKELGVAYAKVVLPDSGNYDIQHSGTVMLFNPEGKLAGFFTPPHKAELLAKDYQLALKATA